MGWLPNGTSPVQEQLLAFGVELFIVCWCCHQQSSLGFSPCFPRVLKQLEVSQGCSDTAVVTACSDGCWPVISNEVPTPPGSSSPCAAHRAPQLAPGSEMLLLKSGQVHSWGQSCSGKEDAEGFSVKQGRPLYCIYSCSSWDQQWKIQDCKLISDDLKKDNECTSWGFS